MVAIMWNKSFNSIQSKPIQSDNYYRSIHVDSAIIYISYLIVEACTQIMEICQLVLVDYEYSLSMQGHIELFI